MILGHIVAIPHWLFFKRFFRKPNPRKWMIAYAKWLEKYWGGMLYIDIYPMEDNE